MLNYEEAQGYVSALEEGKYTRSEWYDIIKTDNAEMHERYPEVENFRLFDDDEIKQIIDWLDDDGYVISDEADEIIRNGQFDAAVALMDDDLREEVHAEVAPCTDAEFLEAYMQKHLEKYGEAFRV